MTTENARYNMMELMVVVASRQLEDGKTAVIGTGMPLAAAMLAQKTISPNLITMFEAGAVAPRAGEAARVGRRLLHPDGRPHAQQHGRGHGDVPARPGGLHLPGRRADRHVRQYQLDHGRHRHPAPQGAPARQRRSQRPGEFLLADPGHHAARQAAFFADLGLPDHAGLSDRARAPASAAGLPPGTGPYKVISTLALIGYDPETCRMRVESLHPGVTKEDVIANTGFEILFADPLPVTPEPTDFELKILREEVDPQGLITGKG